MESGPRQGERYVAYTFNVPAIVCQGCIDSLKNVLNKLAMDAGSRSHIRGNAQAKTITITLKSEIDAQSILNTLVEVGYDNPAPSLILVNDKPAHPDAQAAEDVQAAMGVFAHNVEEEKEDNKRSRQAEKEADELMMKFAVMTLKSPGCVETVEEALKTAGAQKVQYIHESRTFLVAAPRGVQSRTLLQAVKDVHHEPSQAEEKVIGPSLMPTATSLEAKAHQTKRGKIEKK